MKHAITLLLTTAILLTACAQPAAPSSSVTPVTVVSESSSQASEKPESEPEPEPEPKPDNRWTLDTPENHQMNPEVFERLHTALADSNVYAMVTAKDGVIIDEYYGEGSDATTSLPLHSCSKSFTGTLIGIAIEQGYIKSEDDLLSDYLPQVAELEGAKSTLTLRHLLTQTSGLEWYEWGGGVSNWQAFRSAENWVAYILGRRLVAQPGTVFNYSTGNTHLLSAALESATGMNQLEFAQKNLFESLGMDSVTWGADPQGVTDGGNGIAMTGRDAARFGQLLLQEGVWHDEQLVPLDWLKTSTTAQNNGAGDGTGSYGFQWWIRSFGGYDTVYAFGAWGQYILIVPELNLVTVMASKGPQNSYAPRPFFTDYVLAAYEGDV